MISQSWSPSPNRSLCRLVHPPIQRTGERNGIGGHASSFLLGHIYQRRRRWRQIEDIALLTGVIEHQLITSWKVWLVRVGVQVRIDHYVGWFTHLSNVPVSEMALGDMLLPSSLDTYTGGGGGKSKTLPSSPESSSINSSQVQRFEFHGLPPNDFDLLR
jgi:hypothetical protein